LVVSCQWSGGETFTNIQDSKTNTWHQVGSELASSGTNKERTYYAYNITGGTLHTVQFTTTNVTSTFPLIFVSEFSGLATASDPFDQNAGTTGSSTTPDSGTTGTRAQANELLYGAVANGSSGTVTYTAGSTPSTWTIPTNGSEGNGASNATGAVEYLVVSSAGTDSAPMTISPTEAWTARVATFKDITAGGGGGSGDVPSRQFRMSVKKRRPMRSERRIS